MPTINYAPHYGQMLANAYPKSLHFGALWAVPNKNRYKVVNAQKIAIPVVDVTGRHEGNRGAITGYTKQRHSNDWEEKILTNHREWDDFIAPIDIIQTNMVLTVQNITQTYNEQEKFPEMDSYVSSKLYTDWAAIGGAANTETLTKDNVLSYIDEVMEAMDEAFVPAAGRILYVTPQVNTMIKNAKEIQRYLSANESAINRTINRVEDLVIEVVPSTLMKTAYDFTEGAKPAAGASQIDMMFLHPTAVLPVQQYSFVMLDPPSTLSKGKWTYFEESFEDIFILNRRKDALAFHTTAPKA